jgi:hypothetical protein
MEKRLKLDGILRGVDENVHVYFQPPEGMLLDYPAIVYSRSRIRDMRADNIRYLGYDAYQITVIDQDPDSIIVSKMKQLPYCNWDRNFKSDNLNHDVFTIYI